MREKAERKQSAVAHTNTCKQTLNPQYKLGLEIFVDVDSA